MRRLLIILVMLAPVSGAVAAEPVGAVADGLRLAARTAPGDVTLAVHVRDAAALRAGLESRPVARWGHGLLAGGQAGAAWHRLAEAAGVDPGRLFDLCFGDEVTLLLRGSGAAREWVVVTRVEPRRLERVLARLRVALRSPVAGFAVSELPEHDVLLARRDDRLLIAPRDRSGLLHAVLHGEARGGVPGGALADHPGVDRVAALGAGQVAVVARHDPPLGGWSALVARLDGEKVRLSCDAQFAAAPFQRDITEIEWDAAPLAAFAERSLLAVAEPTDIGASPVERFAEAMLAEPLVSPEMRANLGDCRIIAMGEVEGRLEQPRRDLLLPTAAVCLKLVDPRPAETQLDRKMVRLLERIRAVGDCALLMEVPPPRGLAPGAPRHVDLEPAADCFGAGFPVMQSVSFNWTVATGPHGSYYVIATHPRQLDETVAALAAESPGPAATGRWAQCGVADGRRLGAHLRSYGDRAELFAEGDQAEAFAGTLRLASDLAAGVRRCRWTIERPSRQSMKLRVHLRLAPPESAGDDAASNRSP